ncbi:YciI family protein [Mucilaginibacter sp. McL0603]|uniref:YciI family protein n=1 Tax=Mucilaginibacter sp. McL0603 TaxID=3415670 RepID=UPI003CF6662C
MKKYFLLIALLFAGSILFAQNKVKSQYLLIIRFKTDFKPASDDVVKANIKKWQDYMGNLVQSGSLVAGYRPASEGLTISGNKKDLKPIPYIADGELVSSILIINAVDMDAAKAIADKCPVFEFGGSVEVRPVMNIAGQ